MKVIYCTDDAGDHKAEITELTKDAEKEFKSLEEAESFIAECTLVRNLDELYEVPNMDSAAIQEQIPSVDNQLIAGE